MGRKAANYTEKYKNTIVEFFNSEKTYSELNSEYGVQKTTIRHWVTKHEKTEYKIDYSKEVELISKVFTVFAY